MALRQKTANELLREKRAALGLRLVDVQMQLEPMLKPLGIRGITTGTLQRWETSTPPEKMNLTVLVGLTIVYKCSPRELVPERADEIEALKEMLLQSPGCLTADDALANMLVTHAA